MPPSADQRREPFSERRIEALDKGGVERFSSSRRFQDL
jgi:hypothetical protein